MNYGGNEGAGRVEWRNCEKEPGGKDEGKEGWKDGGSMVPFT